MITGVYMVIRRFSAKSVNITGSSDIADKTINDAVKPCKHLQWTSVTVKKIVNIYLYPCACIIHFLSIFYFILQMTICIFRVLHFRSYCFSGGCSVMIMIHCKPVPLWKKVISQIGFENCFELSVAWHSLLKYIGTLHKWWLQFFQTF